MRLLLPIVIGAFITANVQAFGRDFTDIAFKKYAVVKVFEDCVGKENVAKMFSELKQAVTVCSKKPLALFKLVDQAKVDGSVINQENYFTQQAKSSSIQNPWPIFFARPYIVPQSFDGVPYYPNSGYLRSDYGHDPLQERFIHEYLYGMTPSRGFGPHIRRAKEATDAKAVSNNQDTIQAETSSTADQDSVLRQDAQPSLEVYLLKHPTVQKLFGKLNYKMGNMTCVMEEMRFLKSDMTPDYDAIRGRIEACPIDPAIKTDFLEGVDTCKDYSQCVPLKAITMSVPVMPIFNDIVRSFEFMDCLKRRKVEACMKKDLREKIDTILGAVDWATSRQSDELEAEVLQSDDADLLKMLFGFDIFSGLNGLF